MRRLWLLPLALIAAGCSGGGETEESAASAPPKQVSIKEPALDSASPLAIVGVNGEVHLGQSRAEVVKVFPKPDQANPVSELPEVLRGHPGYGAESWHFDNQGFGIILYGDRAALIVVEQDGLTAEQLRSYLVTQRFKNGDESAPDVEGRFSHYHFWEKPGTAASATSVPPSNQRVMICAFMRPDSSFNVTTVLGVSDEMDALRMSVQAANEDKDAADTDLEDFFKKMGKTMPPKPAATAPVTPSGSPTSSPSAGLLGGLH